MAQFSQALSAAFARPQRIYATIAAAAEPTPELSVAEWAEQRRFVSAESGSGKPGKWSNATTPFAVEIMDCLAPDHPAHIVTMKMGAQIVKTEVLLNWIGQTMDVDPAPMLVLQPSLSEVRLFSSTKFEPMVQATPSLRGKVFEMIERSKSGSTTSTKKFRGGVLHLASAGTSKDLQAKSVKRVACDEVSEYEADVGGRGDPVDQAITRTDGHPDYKIALASTPKDLPNCRITIHYEKGDRREYYVACPHCDWRQTLLFERLSLNGDAGVYACSACGVLIGEEYKTPMLAGGVWIKTYPSEEENNPAPPACFAPEELERWRARPTEGREPSFYLSQVYSPHKPWSRLLREAKEADKDPATRKTFRQQKLGLAWDPSIDAPDHEALYKVRGEHVQRGLVPSWACLLTGAADVQNDRIEWAVYAWGPDKSGARIDWGVCEGDTSKDEPYIALAEVVGRRWPGVLTRPLGLDWFGIDSGGGAGRTAKVYNFVRRSIGLKAIKGSSQYDALPFAEGGMGKAKTVQGQIAKAKVYFVGGWGVKKTIYAMLYRAIDAYEAGERLAHGLYFTSDASEETFKQLTAEVFKEPKSRRAGAVGTWERIAQRANEQLDLAVYNYAGAWDKGLERFGPTEWAQLFAARAKLDETTPLLDFASREAEANMNAHSGAPARPQTPGQSGGQDSAASPAPSPAAESEPQSSTGAAPATAGVEASRSDGGPAAAAQPAAGPPSQMPVARLAPNTSAGAKPAWMEKLAAMNNQRKPQ